MFSSYIQRIAPMILTMMMDSGIQRPRRPRLVTYGGPAVTYNFQGTGITLVRTDKKLGRNDACSCGSGKKFKHCCGG